MPFALCPLCHERHPNHPSIERAPEPAGCYICQGALERLPALVKDAVGLAAALEWSDFSVSTTFPRPMMVREEHVLDEGSLDGSMAMKNQINRRAADLIEKQAGKPFSPSADLTFKLDFKSAAASATPANVFIFGRYEKKTRAYCQHEWACQACRGKGCVKCGFQKQNWPSIEGSIRAIFAPAFGASDALIHCSGREDVDVMNLGTGRPFIIELVHPAKRKADLAALATEVARQHPLALHDLDYCSSDWVEGVCVSHFDKHYRAWMAADRDLTDADWAKVEAALPILLHQRTPQRVMQRRADLVRPRRVYSIKPFSRTATEWVLDIHAEAGTYIKELIHGDKGRTVPSISSLIGTPCRCTQLDVTGFDDAFLDTLAKPGE